MNKLDSLEGCLWTANPAIRVRTPGEGEGNDTNFLRLFFEKMSKKNWNSSTFITFFVKRKAQIIHILLM